MASGMTHRTAPSLSLLLVAALAPAGCDLAGGASFTEMRMAVDESVATGEASGLEDGLVEITTDFSIGEGLVDVAGRIRALVESQIPCSTVEATDADTLVIDFGTLDDSCTYNGRTYAGIVTLHYEVQGETVVVEHSYDGITNGRVTLDGDATVTWSRGPDGGVQRHIVSAFDHRGKRGDFHSEADRTQTFRDPGSGVFTVEGTRLWQGPRGDTHAQWEATIDVDFAVPIDGSAVIDTPSGHELTLGFEQIDEDTVEVTVTGGRRGDRVFRVTSSGAVEED